MTDKIISKNYNIVYAFWIGLFLMNILCLFFVFNTDIRYSEMTNANFKLVNMAYTIVFILIILYNYFNKKHKLHYQFLNQIGEGKVNIAPSSLLFLKPFKNEIAIVHGLLYHIRKQFTIIYISLFLLTVGNYGYFIFTTDRKNFYTFFIVTLFSLMINYPRKSLWDKIEYLKDEEENHDPF
ncbi:MAG: hypothetical protein Kow00108_19910 [Calditrichia bacterium]